VGEKRVQCGALIMGLGFSMGMSSAAAGAYIAPWYQATVMPPIVD